MNMPHQTRRSSRALLATAFLLQAVPAAGQTILELLLAPFLTAAAQRTCSSVQDIFAGPANLFDCECDASFTLVNGIKTDISCGLESSTCLLGETFCGKTKFDATYGVRTGLGSGQACLEFDSGIPGIPALEDLVKIPELCIKGNTDRDLRFGTCEVTMGGSACQTCTVCESGVDVTFDCSNVNINPLTLGGTVLKIPGPKINQCVGIGLIPGLGVGANSIPLFGDRESD